MHVVGAIWQGASGDQTACHVDGDARVLFIAMILNGKSFAPVMGGTRASRFGVSNVPHETFHVRHAI
jgi:hypothetical protein